MRRLLELWGVGRTVTSAAHPFTRLLMSMAAIAIFTAFAAMLVLLLSGGALWLGYLQLTASGIEPQIAILILGGIIFALLSAVVLCAQHYMRRMSSITQNILPKLFPASNNISHVADAFMDGLLSDAHSRP